MSDPICPACGLKNPVGTTTCRCGRALPPPTNVSPAPTPIGPAAAPDALIPRTEIRHVAPAQPGQAPGQVPALPQGPATGSPGLPAAGRNEQVFAPNPTPLPTRPPSLTPHTVPGTRGMKVLYFLKSLLAILFLLALAAGGYLYYAKQKAESTPEAVVSRLAVQYLTALSQNDYAAAYAMLSRAAQSQSSLDEFRLLRDTTPWTWANISIATVEPGAIVVQYDLTLQGGAPQKDFVAFIQEGDRWVRPYTWGLLKKIEQAFDRGDPDMAMLLAQAAVTVDPRDPMARGYLCEAYYYRKVPQSAQKECEAALQLIQEYPSKLSLKSLYHLHAILGDTYKNALRVYDRAADEYTLMLKFPALSADDQCQLLLARADTYAQMAKNQEALNDLAGAASVCAKPEDQQFILQKRAALSQPAAR